MDEKNMFLVVYINISSKLITYVFILLCDTCTWLYVYSHVLYTDHYITVHTVHNIVIINAGLLTHIIYSIKKYQKALLQEK